MFKYKVWSENDERLNRESEYWTYLLLCLKSSTN